MATAERPAPPALCSTSPVDVHSILEARSKNLPTDSYAYKLAGNGTNAQYGLDLVLNESPEFDQSRMAMWIPFANGQRRDGAGDLLEIGGIDCSRHMSNPLVLFDHAKTVSLPVGMAEDPDKHQYTVVLDPVAKQAKLLAFFYQGKGDLRTSKDDEYDHALFCEQLYDLAVKRFVRGGSIGYQVKRAVQLPPDYETGVPSGLHLLQTLMLEGSLVVLPANQDTVGSKALYSDPIREALSLPKVCGKALSPVLVKSLSDYLPTQTKVITGYEGKSMGTKSEFAGDLNWLKEEQAEAEHKKLDDHLDKEQIKVPHGNLSKTNVPPSRWKPGLGAIKALRAKYKAQASPDPKVRAQQAKEAAAKLNSSRVDTASDVRRLANASRATASAYHMSKAPGSKQSARNYSNMARNEDALTQTLPEKSIKSLRAKYKAQASKDPNIRARQATQAVDNLWANTNKPRKGTTTSSEHQRLANAYRAASSSYQQGSKRKAKRAAAATAQSATHHEQAARIAKALPADYKVQGQRVIGIKALRAKYKQAMREDEAKYRSVMTGDAPKDVRIGEKILKHEGDSWNLYSHHGRLLGRHPTREAALAQERAVEAHKHGKALAVENQKALSALNNNSGGALVGAKMDATRKRRTADPARQEYYRQSRTERFARHMNSVGDKPAQVVKVQKQPVGIKALRQKYATAKGRFRRLKRGSPGSSLIKVSAKDLDRFKEEAEKRGVQVHLKETTGGHAKCRLVGSDANIDHLAKTFGCRM